MPTARIREAAELLGVTDDTVRRWIDQGILPVSQDASDRKVITGDALAGFAREMKLETGSLAVAVIKATNVIVETPNETR